MQKNKLYKQIMDNISVQVKKALNESNSDNLHQFIQYLKDTGKEGVLKTNLSNIVDLYDEADPSNCQKFNYIIYSQYAEDYEEENGLEDVTDDLEGFVEYLKESIKENLLGGIDLSNNYLIYCERVITIPNFYDNNEFYDYCKNKYDGTLGVYWTYLNDFGSSYCGLNGGGMSGMNVTICGYVRPEDVDWDETICANLVDPDEYELTLNIDAPILIKEIKAKNHIIFKGNLIYKA